MLTPAEVRPFVAAGYRRVAAYVGGDHLAAAPWTAEGMRALAGEGVVGFLPIWVGATGAGTPSRFTGRSEGVAALEVMERHWRPGLHPKRKIAVDIERGVWDRDESGCIAHVIEFARIVRPYYDVGVYGATSTLSTLCGKGYGIMFAWAAWWTAPGGTLGPEPGNLDGLGLPGGEYPERARQWAGDVSVHGTTVDLSTASDAFVFSPEPHL